MALNAFIPTLEEISDELKTEYVATDGGFKLDVTAGGPVGGGTLELVDAGGVKSALGKEREAATAAKNDLKQYAGLDLEQIKIDSEFHAKYAGKTEEDLQTKMAEAKGVFDIALQEANQKVLEANQKVSNYRLGHSVDGALAGIADKIQPGLNDFLRDHILKSTKEVDGRAIMHDANGNPIVSVDPASAGWMGPAEYAQSLQSNEKFNSFFKANVTTGGSGNSTAGGIKGAQLLNRVEFDKLDYIDRDKAVKSNPDHYNKFLD